MPWLLRSELHREIIGRRRAWSRLDRAASVRYGQRVAKRDCRRSVLSRGPIAATPAMTGVVEGGNLGTGQRRLCSWKKGNEMFLPRQCCVLRAFPDDRLFG